MICERCFFDWLLITAFLMAAMVFIILFFYPAPYGKMLRKGWGPAISARSGWIIMEFPSLFLMIFFFFVGNRTENLPAIIFLIVWTCHYFQRTAIYPFIIREKGKTMPLLIMFMAIVYNLMNGYLNGRWLFSLSPQFGSDWLKDFRFLSGTLLFFIGFVINIRSDNILRSLRLPGETIYRIPAGFLYRYVSCPNYFGELIEWLGWALLTWSLPGLAFMLFTAANLIPRADSYHRWYISNFPEYPKERKRVIPFVY